MASKVKKACKYGAKCYRKNKQHLEEFSHPEPEEKVKKSEDEDSPPAKKLKKDISEKGGKKGRDITDFFGKKTEAKTEKVKEQPKKEGKAKDEDKSEKTEEKTEAGDKEDEEKAACAGAEPDSESSDAPESPTDVKENIKHKFLVDMPEDFYAFWEFAKTINSSKPNMAFKKSLGVELVGPYDVLGGRCVKKNSKGKTPCYLRHWRYYYDPPEFMTVIRGDDDTQFHMGYFRDDPQEMPVFVASNAAKKNCTISPRGENIFSAIRWPDDDDHNVGPNDVEMRDDANNLNQPQQNPNNQPKPQQQQQQQQQQEPNPQVQQQQPNPQQPDPQHNPQEQQQVPPQYTAHPPHPPPQRPPPPPPPPSPLNQQPLLPVPIQPQPSQPPPLNQQPQPLMIPLPRRNPYNADDTDEDDDDDQRPGSSWFIDDYIKENKSSKSSLTELKKKLESAAKTGGFSLEQKTKSMKARDKKVNCKLFHGAGMVVPVDDNDVGYREVPETPGDLKKMFKKVVEAKTDSERDAAMDPLMEIIMLVQFANDECDYGEGLELGLDMFSYGGGDAFKSTLLNLLPMAYQLLGRHEYIKVIQAHLEDRVHTAKLNQLE